VSSRPRPRVIVFDVLETLFPLDPLKGFFQAEGLDPALMRLWFERTLRNAFALTATGEDLPFRQIGLEALADVTDHRLSASAMERILGGFGELEPRPDAAPAMHSVRESGVRIVVLTNGAAITTQQLLERGDLSDLVEIVISVEEAGRWKPRPEPYRYTAEMCGEDLLHTAMVSAHSWDVHGARRAGLTTGWSGHLEHRFPRCFDAPDVTGPDLQAVVLRLLRLPRDSGPRRTVRGTTPTTHW
jgi:2-haloacid dehalogenase